MTIFDSGQKLDSTNDGQIRTEYENGRIVLFDGNVYQMIIGKLPDGTVGAIFMKEGEDAFDAFD